MSEIWYKNIRSFLRYRNFRVGTFFTFTLYTALAVLRTDSRCRQTQAHCLWIRVAY